jgi:hypothetical protein
VLVEGIKVGNMNAPGLELGYFIQLRLSEPQYHVAATQQGISVRFDSCANLSERVVRVPGTFSSAGLDGNVGAKPHELFDCVRGDGRTVFTRVCLTGYR